MNKNTKQEMKLNFYDTFHCIADKCSITCCQEWKIEVDGQTKKRWNSLSLKEDGQKTLNEYVGTKDSSSVICLNEKNKCPFLNDEKLCKLVIQLGEDTLSKTCTTFPREVHKFEDRTEYSLVCCCPEIVDRLNQQEKIEFVKSKDFNCQDELFQIRDTLFTIIQNRNLSLSKAIMIGYYMLQELYEKECLGEAFDENQWEKYKDDALQKELAGAFDNMEFSDLNTLYERNELFLDLAENYRKEQLYVAYLHSISELAEELEDDCREDELLEEVMEFQTQLKEYENLFRNYVTAELFTNSLIPDSSFESMVMMYQWITMEYVTMEHALFLKWKSEGKAELSYTTVRDYIVIISRMTGYDQEDIEEYFENCFESVIWEWGYLALLAGNNAI